MNKGLSLKRIPTSLIHKDKEKEGWPENGAVSQGRSRARTQPSLLPRHSITAGTQQRELAGQ